MMKIIYIIILFLWVFLYSGTEASSIESLKVNGGGYITSISVDPNSPNIVYGSSDLGGMYKSTNYGDEWRIINKGLVTDADLAIATTAIDPQNSNVVYIGTGHIWGTPSGNYGGIFKTVNGGADWELITRKVKFAACGTFDVQGRLIVVDPKNSNIIYAGSHKDGIFKSTDGGASWVLKGLAGNYISSVVVDPINTNTIYVSAQITISGTQPGLFKSTDGGNTWQTLTRSYNVYDLTIDSQNPQILYAAAYNQGIYKTTDGGTTWTSKTPVGTLDSDDPNCIAGEIEYVSIAASPTNPQIVYTKSKCRNQVYKTTNGGDTWEKIPSSNSNIFTGDWDFDNSLFAISSSGITVDPTNSNRVYLGTWYAIWRSDDSGNTWTVKPNGLETSAAQATAVNPDSSNELYSCHADIGLYKSVDSGATWTRIPEVGGNCWAIAIDNSTNPITIYVGTGSWSGSTTNGKIFKSTDNGKSWSDTINGLTDSRIRSIVIDPTNPSIVYTGHTNGRIYKSTNKGSSWSKKSSGLGSSEVLQIVINPSSPNIVYAVQKNNGIYKSTNGGDSWSSINNGIGTLSTNDIALDPNNPNIVYVVCKGYGIYRSTDAGGSWINVHSNYDGLSLAVDSNSVIYAGGKAYWSSSNNPGLYKSTDGTTWIRIDEGLLNQGIDNIEIDPTNNNCLYISTRGDGTFRVDMTATSTNQSNDGIDNNDDGLIDQEDPGCSSTDDNDEYTPSSETYTITSRISQGSDDAEEHVHNGYIDLGSSDLELVLDQYTQTIGLRFQNIQVPNGATITNAYVEFETDETGSTSTDLTFYGEDVDNSVTFIPGYSYNVSRRTKTSASVTWLNVPAWDTINEKHQTPDISPIIQEIVNRNNWASGNALSIIVTGSGRRTAESYNKEPDNAPLLVVEYRTDGPLPTS
ncbi:MAG: hypothetical protein K8R25_02530 [Methanosarcinales archaeon]|nr:hypothetical protein [Methanosarcinales archaeon]